MFKSSLTLQDSEGVPIHLCVLVGHVKLVEKAIEAKVDVNLKCPESGETPLHLAVAKELQKLRSRMVQTSTYNLANFKVLFI